MHKWGREIWLTNTPLYCAKIIVLERQKGYQSSLHYHERKDETFVVIQGTVRIEIEGKTQEIKGGKLIRILPGQKHRFRPVTNVAHILEISTADDDDNVKIEEATQFANP